MVHLKAIQHGRYNVYGRVLLHIPFISFPPSFVREQKPRTRTAGPVVPQCVVSPHNPFLPQHCRVHEERREKVYEDEVGIPLAFDYG